MISCQSAHPGGGVESGTQQACNSNACVRRKHTELEQGQSRENGGTEARGPRQQQRGKGRTLRWTRKDNGATKGIAMELLGSQSVNSLSGVG